MATKESSDTLIVLESFIGQVDGEERIFRHDELIRASDPAVKKWPSKFGPVKFLHDRVEQATAAPGETR